MNALGHEPSRAQAAVTPVSLAVSRAPFPWPKKALLSPNTCIQLGWYKHLFISPSLRGYRLRSTPCKCRPVLEFYSPFVCPSWNWRAAISWHLSLENTVLILTLIGLCNPFSQGFTCAPRKRCRAAGKGSFCRGQGSPHPSFRGLVLKREEGPANPTASPRPNAFSVATRAGSRDLRIAIRLLLVALVVFHV